MALKKHHSTKAVAIDTYREWLEDLQQAPTLVQHVFNDIPSAFANWGTEIFNYYDFNRERTVEVEETLNYGVDFSTTYYEYSNKITPI